MDAVAQDRDIQQIVFAQRVDHLFESTPIGQIAHLICATLLVSFLWNVIPTGVLLAWLAAAAVSGLARYALVLLYRRNRSNVNAWIVRYRVSLLGSGLVWGTAGVVLFPADSPALQAYLLLVLTIIVAGGIAMYSVVRGTMYWFILPSVPPYLYSLLAGGTIATYGLFMLLALVFVVSIKLSHDMHRVYSQSFLAAEQLRTEKDLALQATREKDKYVSLIAHDLKSPFSSLIQLLSLLDNDDEPLDAEKRDVLRSIRQRCEDSVATIDGVLHASRFTSSGIVLKRRFLDAHMEALGIVVNFKHQAESKGIEIVNEVPEGMRVYADAQLYREVLNNLVSNAVKFCTKGDRISLFAPPGEAATLAVRDTGTGIDPELLAGLFRQDVKTTRPGTHGEKGTGLGLPICKEIMAAHGGDLVVESAPGQGSVFYARLPSHQPLVLVVDDDVATRYALRKQLASERFTVEEAANGEVAIRKVAELKPHLVLLDIFLPKLDGLAVLERLKEDPATRDVPVIVTTSDSRIETRQTALHAGAVDFLAKPVRIEELVPRALRALA